MSRFESILQQFLFEHFFHNIRNVDLIRRIFLSRLLVDVSSIIDPNFSRMSEFGSILQQFWIERFFHSIENGPEMSWPNEVDF